MDDFILLVMAPGGDAEPRIWKLKTKDEACEFLGDRNLRRYAIFNREGLLVPLIPGNYAAIERQLNHQFL